MDPKADDVLCTNKTSSYIQALVFALTSERPFIESVPGVETQ